MNTSLISATPRNACSILDRPEGNEATSRAEQPRTTQRSERTERAQARSEQSQTNAVSSGTTSAAIRGGGFAQWGESIQKAAARLLDPKGQCTSAVSRETAALSADFKALAPKLKTFAHDLQLAGPALKQAGQDSYKVVSGITSIIKGMENLVVSGALEVGTIGGATPVAVIEATVGLIQLGKGLNDVMAHADKLPGDWKTLKPHLEQLKKDFDAMAPELNKLKYDAERALGTVRQECIRM